MANQDNQADNFRGGEDIPQILSSFVTSPREPSVRDNIPFTILAVVEASLLIYIAVRFFRNSLHRRRLIRQGVECPICRVAIASLQELHITPCGHSFHEDCLQEWLNQRLDCPMCRGPLHVDV